MKSLLWVLPLALGLSACSVATRMGMRPATAPVFLVLGGELYTGEAQGFNDRRASVALHTEAAEGASPLTCAGTLAFTMERGGSIDLSCSNGTRPQLTFESTGWATGFAYSPAGDAPASLTFGLAADQASAYLRAPSGKKLVLSPPDTLKLE